MVLQVYKVLFLASQNIQSSEGPENCEEAAIVHENIQFDKKS